MILLSLLLVGCARFQPQPLSPEKNAENLQSRSLTNAALKPFLEQNLGHEIAPWPPAAWDFDMLSLAAFYYQPVLELARAQWTTARGGEITAAQRPNPILTLLPGYSTSGGLPSPWLPFTFVDIPLETAGKRSRRRVLASHLADAARLNISSVAWQVRSNLRSSLLDLALTRERVALLEKQPGRRGPTPDLWHHGNRAQPGFQSTQSSHRG